MVLEIQLPNHSPLRPWIERSVSSHFNSTKTIPFVEYLPFKEIEGYLPSKAFEFLVRSKRVHAVQINKDQILVHPEGFFKFKCLTYQKQVRIEQALLSKGPFILQ